MKPLSLLVFAFLGVAACAPPAGTRPLPRAGTVTTHDLAPYRSGSLWDALEHLMPAAFREWSAVTVYVDQVRAPQGIEILHVLRADEVVRVERLSDGQGSAGPVLVVTMLSGARTWAGASAPRQP